MTALDAASLAGLLAAVQDPTSSSQARGQALESYTSELLSAIPGVTVACTNSFDVFGCQEIDVACENVGVSAGLQGFDRIILVECKNWADAVGSMEVAWFDTKLRVRGRTCGILIALNGITGDQQSLKNAHQILAAALAEKREILVVTVEELSALTDSDEVAELLRRRSLELNLSRGLP